MLSLVDKAMFSSEFQLYPRFRGKGFKDFFIDTRIRTKGTKLEKGEKLGRTKWYNYLHFTLVAISIQFIFGWSYAFPKGRPACGSTDSNTTISYISLADFSSDTKNSNICDLVETFKWGNNQLIFLTAIVLGGYIVATINMWRLRRINYMILLGSIRNLTIQIGTLVRKQSVNKVMNNEEEEQENITWLDERHKMLRWAVLGFELAVLKARNKMDTDQGRKRLEDKELLREGEWENMVNEDRHTTVWYWIQRKAVTLTDQGVISSEQTLQIICTMVTRTQGHADDLMNQIAYDHCPVYTSVVGITIFYTIVNFILWKGFQWAIWFYDTNGAVWKEPRMYFEVLISISYTTILAAVFDIDKVMHSPFGLREIDLPWEDHVLDLLKLTRSFGSSEEDFPVFMLDREASKSSKYDLNRPTGKNFHDEA